MMRSDVIIGGGLHSKQHPGEYAGGQVLPGPEGRCEAAPALAARLGL